MYNVNFVPPSHTPSSRCVEIRKYIKQGTFPSRLPTNKKRVIQLKEPSYQLFHGVFFRKHHNDVLLNFLESLDSKKVLK